MLFCSLSFALTLLTLLILSLSLSISLSLYLSFSHSFLNLCLQPLSHSPFSIWMNAMNVICFSLKKVTEHREKVT